MNVLIMDRLARRQCSRPTDSVVKQNKKGYYNNAIRATVQDSDTIYLKSGTVAEENGRRRSCGHASYFKAVNPR
jgi:hypothetical protein